MRYDFLERADSSLLDRCLSLYFLTWKQKCGKLTRTKYHIALLTFVCLLLNAHILFFNGYRTDTPKSTIKCYATRDNPHYIFPQWERVHLVVYNLCPFLIMCLCNTYIIYVTIRSARVRSPVTGQSNRNRQISIMLMLVTFVFVLLTLPSCLYFVFFRHRMSSEEHSRRYRYMVQTCLGGVQFTSHAINFFLYCFSTKNFRNELADFLQEIFFFTTAAKTTATVRRGKNERRFNRQTYRHQESTLENEQTGQQYVLKDLQTSLLNDGAIPL